MRSVKHLEHLRFSTEAHLNITKRPAGLTNTDQVFVLRLYPSALCLLCNKRSDFVCLKTEKHGDRLNQVNTQVSSESRLVEDME